MLHILYSLITLAFILPMQVHSSPGDPQQLRDVSPKIEFMPATFDEILQEARASDKLIFFDAYAVWCGPCKMMESTVFTVPKVAGLYNDNFINAKFDMERGEGIQLKDRYNITAYPTYLFLNAEGEVIHKRVGSSSADLFIQFGLDAMSPFRNLAGMEKSYDDNKHDPIFIHSYLKALKGAGNNRKMSEVSEYWLETQDQETLLSAFNYQLLSDYLENPLSSAFIYFIKHQNAFGERYGTEAVNNKIYFTLLQHANTFIDSRSDDPAGLFQKEAFEEYMAFVENTGYYRASEITGLSRLNVNLRLKDFPSYATIVDEMIVRNDLQQHPNPASQYIIFANNMLRFATEQDVLKKASVWARLASESEGLNDTQLAYNLNIYASLLEKSGNKREASRIRKQIDEMELEKARKETPFQMLIPLE
jgi:thiol-disulfide isomerase/thioredoxin